MNKEEPKEENTAQIKSIHKKLQHFSNMSYCV